MDRILESDILRVSIEQISRLVGGYVPQLVGGIALLILGWLFAYLVYLLIRTALRKLRIGQRLSGWTGDEESVDRMRLEHWIARVVYYVLLLIVLVAFFQTMGLTQLVTPFNSMLEQVLEYLPGVIGAAFLLLVAWIVASVLRFLLTKSLRLLKIDEQISRSSGVGEEGDVRLTTTLGDAAYWLVFLLFLPAVLGSLQLTGLLGPVQGVTTEILTYLPNIFAAVLIVTIGWLFARIIQRIVTNLSGALGVDRITDQAGLQSVLGKQKISDLLGLIVYILILLPVIVSGLAALELSAVTEPATYMLKGIVGVVPALLGAALLLVIAYVVGRLVSGFAVNLLSGIGFDSVLERLGISREITDERARPSNIAGQIILVVIMLFALIEAMHMLEYTIVAELLSQFVVFAGQAIVGLVIFATGLYISNVAARAISAGTLPNTGFLAFAARVSILVLAGAMALGQMGVADDIIQIAFGLVLGSIAVAAAIAFGFGGREIAARKIEEWLKAAETKKK
ncbi:MAG: mechanosensitive ion channel [Leptospirales bacterium]|jgi:hypothetical protein